MRPHYIIARAHGTTRIAGWLQAAQTLGFLWGAGIVAEPDTEKIILEIFPFNFAR